jgi:hypothetical protein
MHRQLSGLIVTKVKPHWGLDELVLISQDKKVSISR